MANRNGMRMLMMAGDRGPNGRQDYAKNVYPGADMRSRTYNARNDYRGGQMNYGGYNRYNDVAEDRFTDRRGREHYDNGRFAPMRGNYDAGEMRMNRIGFDGGYDDEMDDGGFYDPARMHYGGGYDNQMMYGEGYVDDWKLDQHMAEEWAFMMQNADGTTGPHWTMEQTKQVMAQRGLKYDPVQFWAALNASYSDLCEFFKKRNINNIDAYVDFAKAFWLEDKDAPDKISRYYEFIVKQ